MISLDGQQGYGQQQGGYGQQPQPTYRATPATMSPEQERGEVETSKAQSETAVLLMTAAAVGDRFGRRRVFVVGLLLPLAVCGVIGLVNGLLVAPSTVRVSPTT